MRQPFARSATRLRLYVGAVILMTLVSGVVALRLYGQTPDGAVKISRFVSRIPIVGQLLRKIALSRFAHYFATLHESEVSWQ